MGRVTARRMRSLGIRSGRDLRQCSLEFLVRNFGKQGRMYHEFARGIDLRPVQAARIRKSLGCEHTLESDVRSSTGLLVELYRVVLDLEQRILAKGFRGSTLTLKIKYADFTVRTKSASVSEALVERGRILSTAKKLLAQAEEQMPAGAAVRLLGLSVSHASADSPVCYVRQLKLDF